MIRRNKGGCFNSTFRLSFRCLSARVSWTWLFDGLFDGFFGFWLFEGFVLDSLEDFVLGIVESFFLGFALGFCDGLRLFDGFLLGDSDGFSLGVDEGFLLSFALGFCDGLPSYLLVVVVLNRNLYLVFDNKQNFARAPPLRPVSISTTRR